MCTVTFIPKSNKQFILASNRDENRERSTNSFDTRSFGTQKVLFPVDPVSGGSWIAVSSLGKAACVLNGAFDKHDHRPPYAKSRGLVLLDYFQSENIERFASKYDFKGIEPFTLVAFENGDLFELRWDENHTYLEPCNSSSPHIWSSSTLYDRDARLRRNEWFQKWLLVCPEPDTTDLIKFHRYGGERDSYNGLVMNRQDRVQTLSVTAIEKIDANSSIHHYDLIHDQYSKASIN